MELEDVFKSHECMLWGLGYRLTGSAADAEDIVQETFVRAMEHPPFERTSLEHTLRHLASLPFSFPDNNFRNISGKGSGNLCASS